MVSTFCRKKGGMVRGKLRVVVSPTICKDGFHSCWAHLAVYRRDNRFKVAQDEAKAKQEEDAIEARHQQAEREHRHNLLLQKSKQARIASSEEAGPGPGSALDGPSASLQLPGQQAALQHINFWKEDELKMSAQHPDVLVGAGLALMHTLAHGSSCHLDWLHACIHLHGPSQWQGRRLAIGVACCWVTINTEQTCRSLCELLHAACIMMWNVWHARMRHGTGAAACTQATASYAQACQSYSCHQLHGACN